MSIQEFRDHTPVAPFIDPARYGFLSFIFVLSGLVTAAYFLTLVTTGTKETTNLRRQFMLACVGAVFIGFGLIFALLSGGVWI